MERHYTYTYNLFNGPEGANLEKFVFAVLIGLLFIVLGSIASKKIRQPSSNLVPNKKFNLFGFFDFFCESFIKAQDVILGKANRKYFSLCASVFLFIFAGNILGLIPGMPAITTSVWINVAVALMVFIAFNYYGIKENGLTNYLKHFAGGDAILKIWALLPVALLLFVIEIFSICLRVLTLNLRLYWNITADHSIISTLIEQMGGWFIAVGPLLYAKGFLVSLIQAAVFTILTMVYILLATSHEEN